MAELLILRHAQSTWNAARRWQGWADPPLSALGEAQAREAAGRLVALDHRLDDPPQPFSAAVSSDLQRARWTAEILAAEVGITEPVRIEPLLREHDVGEWSGLTQAEIEQRWPGLLQAWSERRVPGAPGGEPRDVFDRRVWTALERVAASAQPDGRLLVVAHGGLIRSVVRSLQEPEWHVGHLSGVQLRVTERGLSPALRVDLLEDEGEPSLAV